MRIYRRVRWCDDCSRRRTREGRVFKRISWLGAIWHRLLRHRVKASWEVGP